MARNKFTNLQSKLQMKNLKEFPKFYKIDSTLLSPNLLQQDRYLESNFTYLSTKYRDLIYEKIQKNQESEKIVLTGIQSSGKSFFLSDFVLRQRSLGENSKNRVLYVNNSEEYWANPIRYIINELIYALCFDCDEDKMLDDLADPPYQNSQINSKNQIIH